MPVCAPEGIPLRVRGTIGCSSRNGPPYRPPFIHDHPYSFRFFLPVAGMDQHPLELLRVLPFLQLHTAQSTACPRIQISEQILELLYAIISYPSQQVLVQSLILIAPFPQTRTPKGELRVRFSRTCLSGEAWSRSGVLGWPAQPTWTILSSL